jgi:hypothetical protein
MKQFAVMAAMIALGVYIYNLIAGPGDGSVMSELAGFFKTKIESRAVVH